MDKNHAIFCQKCLALGRHMSCPVVKNDEVGRDAFGKNGNHMIRARLFAGRGARTSGGVLAFVYTRALALALALIFGLWLISPAFSVQAQIGSASERGADLGALVDTLSGLSSPSTPQGLPCLDIWDRAPDVVGFDCLLGHIGGSFQIPEQWDLTQQIFESRFAARRTWPILAEVLSNRANSEGGSLSPEGPKAKSEDSDATSENTNTNLAEASLGTEAPPLSVEGLSENAQAGELADRLVSDGANLPAAEGARITFADLEFTDQCPALISFDSFLPDDRQVQWLATPEGLRDLSPPRVRAETDDRALLREALRHPDPARVVMNMACRELRVPLTRALVRSALAFGDLTRAQQLATLPFMPRRYGRQALGATQDQAAMLDLNLTAADAVLEGQFALADPSVIEMEVAVLLNEIDRQFAIDFLLGRLWALSLDELLELELDDEFIATIAGLLSQDARLLQQSYGPDEVRFFYTDFFEVLVDKQAFDLLRGVDLLVPAVIRGDFQLALSAQPLTATSPTRFERDQEALALLIRLQEVDAVLGVWSDLSPPQRQDAVLYAFDQGVWAAAGRLYATLPPDEVGVDFLIRLALYYADAMDGEAESAGDLQIDIQVGTDQGDES